MWRPATAASPSSAGPAFDGVVLCGGGSRRMGRDKALLEVDGVAMARRVADALVAAGAVEVVALGGNAAALEPLGLDVVPDAAPGGGPFPAVVQALERPGSPLVVVLACDLVAPDPVAVRCVVEALDRAPAAVGAVPVVDGKEQWVHAAWRRSSAPQLRAALVAGTRSLHRAAAGLALVRVDDVPATAVADADGPDDLPGVTRSIEGGEG